MQAYDGCLPPNGLYATSFHGHESDGVNGQTLNIGIVAADSDMEFTRKVQDELGTHLEQMLTTFRIHLQILSPNELHSAIGNGEVDFLILAPDQALDLESMHGFSRLATMRRRDPSTGQRYGVCGTAIFVNSKRTDIATLSDLYGKSLMGTDPQSLAGSRMALYALLKQGVNPDRDLAELTFGGPCAANVVEAVCAGQVDAGIVPSEWLAQMFRAGTLMPDRIRVLDEGDQTLAPFP